MRIAAEDCAEVLRVLADSTRLHVIRLLVDQPQRVGEMNKTLRIDQSLLSHHLRVMRDAGLVIPERDGKAVRYRLSPKLESQRLGNAIDLGCCRLTFHQPQDRNES